MSDSPAAALSALAELPGTLSLVAVNLRHARDVDNAHGGQDRLLESQATKLDALVGELRHMITVIGPVMDAAP